MVATRIKRSCDKGKSLCVAVSCSHVFCYGSALARAALPYTAIPD